MDEDQQDDEGQNPDDEHLDDEVAARQDGRTIRDYARIEQRIRDGEPVTDEEREDYEQVSQDLRETLKNLRLTTPSLQLPDATRDAILAVSRSQQDQLDRIGEQIRAAFTPRINMGPFRKGVNLYDRKGVPTTPPETSSNESTDRDESKQLQADLAAIDAAPVSEARAYLEFTDYLKEHGEISERGNKLAELQVDETRRLNEIMKLVSDQSDKQGRFATRMAWFMAAVGLGTIVIPVLQWIYGT